MASIPKVKRVFRKRVRLKSSDEDVGYGKPPKANQFRPGKSGNPKGRPKGAKSRELILRELLDSKITMRRDGKIRRITVIEGIFHKVVEDSLKGNIKSATFLLNQLAAIASNAGDESEISRDDKAVLDAYLRDFQSTLGGKEKAR
ncbi:MAG TPA: hypothetical protein DEA80_19805 [Afipia sp.]|jgi:hypothetical protein|uniref:DUF5681 domain-containing protein n=2 Tax=Afipia TaxID=1033 RepID=K8PKV6_9BRAD|nr:DUF5681 domain-containing protein [Afipia broomeae]MAH70243.1 hypothetical protein [Afipia sp.]NGX94608.1 hypothetical protein [Candidatus Afipia apatlaquensis]OUX60627.1 MAG: hypothetical protein CBB64_13490 [Afipia sp. TMED4]EKS41394.1 hypothetical protein HMPREF9695_00486 [Afipia broomeae ATCC 49717]HAO42572.1 hypothetical protein [Afipia sp.]|tara:strand:- start:151 stop:585 length:435 start_codon:yes stop_codon:yes gene_type:complete